MDKQSILLYDIHCKDCNKDFEDFVPATEQEGFTCPFCKGNNTHKIMSFGGFQLIGTGWSKDGYNK